VSWGFFFDSLVGILIFVVCFISLLVHLYSLDYMYYDPGFSRFLCYLSFFTFFMLILVSAANFVQLFLGWEGVGIASYLLINF
jgi:NADH:ubiquinone oxidoreductase subunit 5 (subunit L)/multisubunit Na+/H+ antiporter MnhA subunit